MSYTNGTLQDDSVHREFRPIHRLTLTKHRPSLEAFERLCLRTADARQYPLTESFNSNIPVYNLTDHSPSDISTTTQLQDEWYSVLHSGPGVLILKNFFSKPKLDYVDTASDVYEDIIKQEEAQAKSRGDHFSASGQNSRIWNSFQKHAERDPASFVVYYSNPWLSLISEAWLGPDYQVTAQVNIVRPGGAPQVAHRDYHLGFQTAESCARFPKAMQVASQLLTLQGAVAHADMPLESGPTRFLPFSQIFEDGYMAYRLPEFTAFFDKHWVSAALEKGDAVFFNPALFHAAGENRTTHVERSANLLQISSAFGKPMESIDHVRIMDLCWDELASMFTAAGGWSMEVDAISKAIAPGYPFPTNLDRRPPAPGGMAPESLFDILKRCLEQGLTKSAFLDAVDTYTRGSSA